MAFDTNVLIIGGISGVTLGIIGVGLFFIWGGKKKGSSAKTVAVEKIPAKASEEPLFTINMDQPIPSLPDVKDIRSLDVRYPLIAPYAYAHVHWDAPNNEILYEIEEPVLDQKEQETLRILEDGIRELINLSFVSVKDQKTILTYLEKNVRILLTELAIDLSTDSYVKIMYYIYRDFVGLNELEPLMNDYYIEDVECNGLNTPVYIVHRKFRNIRTNLVYKDVHAMAGFVEKLAQKCGKYVSYAEPMLDGSLPDGSIDHNEPVIYKEKGIVKVGKIGEVIDKYYQGQESNKPVFVEGMEVAAFDQKDFKISWKQAQYVYRHKNDEELYRLDLEFGRNIRLTGCHSVFVLRREGVKSVKTEELKEGDYVILPSKLPENDVVKEINLVKGLSHCSRKEKLVLREVPEAIFEKKKVELCEYYKEHYVRPNQAYYEHKKKRIIPLEMYSLLSEEEMRKCFMGTTSSHKIPTFLPVSRELMWLLGLYIAEGWLYDYASYGISFSLNKQEMNLVDEIRRSAKKCFNLDVRVEEEQENSVKVHVCDFLVWLIMSEVLHVSEGAKRKRVPELIFNVSKELQQEFVKAWHAGDYSTTMSADLANEISYIALFNEDIAAFYKGKPKTAFIKGRAIRNDGAYYSNFYARDVENPYPSMIPVEVFNPLNRTHERLRNKRVGRTRLGEIVNEIRYQRFANLSIAPKKFFLEWEKRGFIKDATLTDEGKKLLEELSLAKRLLDSDFCFAKIRKISRVKATSEFVYDFSVAGDENFVAGVGGICCHNSRVNATYSTDVTSRGPTFTVRKFVKEPWSPITLMQKNSVSPEILAYLWMLIEYENSFMVIGGTGTGKTSFLNAIAFFMPPQARIVTIEDSVTGDADIIIKKKDQIIRTTMQELYKLKNKREVEVLTMDKQLKIKFTKPSAFIKHRTIKDIYRITTATGRVVNVTKDHSLFTLTHEGVIEIIPESLEVGESHIAVPRILPIEGKGISHISLIGHLTIFKKDFLVGDPVGRIFSIYKRKDFKISKSKYQWWKKHKIIQVEYLQKIKHVFNDVECKHLFIKSRTTTKIPVIFQLDEDMLKFIGLWLGDGSYDNYNKNRVIISDNEKEAIALYKRISKKLGINISLMEDDWSWGFNSTVFYKFMKYVLRLDGDAKTKKIPGLIFNLTNEQLKNVIAGYFGADGTVKKNEVSCSSQSDNLIFGVQTLLLRFGIIGRITRYVRDDGCKELNISAYENINKFKEIQFVHEEKNKKLALLGNVQSTHTSSDVIPMNPLWLPELAAFGKQLRNYHSVNNSFPGRRFVNNFITDETLDIPESAVTFLGEIANSDLLWDKVVKIEKLKKRQRYVYDISVPETEKFIAQNILLHNTRELKLEHENWLPSVARAGVGLATNAGTKYGEVTLFDLLKASFRQRPDYIIVGEVRGAEAYVLFQAMASGHPSTATMHAENVETMVRRLQTQPINLSGSLVMTLAAVVVMQQTRIKGKEVRKVSSVDEVVDVKEMNQGGQVVVNNIFKWNPANDTFAMNPNSRVFKNIMEHYGLTREQVANEFRVRARLLSELYRRNVSNYKEVQDVIHKYYKNPDEVLKKYGIAK